MIRSTRFTILETRLSQPSFKGSHDGNRRDRASIHSAASGHGAGPAFSG